VIHQAVLALLDGKALPPALGIALGRHLLHLEAPDEAGDGEAQLHVGDALADAATGAEREGVEGALGQLEGLLVAVQPALRAVHVGLGVVGGVVVDGVDGHADASALGDVVAVDLAGSDGLARQEAGHGRRQAHGLVDAGLEVLAVGQLLAGDDLLGRREARADLALQLGQLVGVAAQLEDGGRERGGGCRSRRS